MQTIIYNRLYFIVDYSIVIYECYVNKLPKNSLFYCLSVELTFISNMLEFYE